MRGRGDQGICIRMAGKANLFAFGMIILLLIGGAALLVYHRISLTVVQLQRSYLLFGTQVDLTVRARSHDQGERALKACFQEMERLQTLMDVYSADSEISRLNHKANVDWVAPGEEIFSLILQSLKFSEASQGAFDITVGPLLSMWRDARNAGAPPPGTEIQMILARIGYTNLRVDPRGARFRFLKKGMALDLGGIAKGYALDRGKEVLIGEGIQQALLNAGGDVLALGGKGNAPWKIGIQDPRDPDALIGTLEISDAAVVTSGDYERFFIHEGKRYHHILDPQTGYPSTGCRSVTVVGPRATEADAVATAAFVMGPDGGLAFLEKNPDMDGIIIDDKGERHLTSGLRDKVRWTCRKPM